MANSKTKVFYVGVLTLLSVLAASAQTPVDVTFKGCRGNAVMIAGVIPTTNGAVTANVPMCVALGPGLTINTSVTPPRLEMAVQQITLPRSVIQVVPLAGLPGTQTSLTVTLQYTPIASSAMFAIYQSSMIGQDRVLALMPGGGAAPKSVIVSPLPSHRPLTADDTLTIVYQTVEPAVP